MIAPDVLAVDNTCKQRFIFREAVCSDKLQRLFSFDEIQTDTIKIQHAKCFVTVADIAEIGLRKYLHTVFVQQDFFVESVEQCNILCCQILDKRRFIKLHPFRTECIEFCQNCSICSGSLFDEISRLF